MSNKNKKSAVTQALLEMDAITSAIKEESKKSLNTLLAEAVRDALREGCEEEEEKDYDVYDDEKDDANDNDDEATKGSAKSDVDEDGNDEMANGVDANVPTDGMGADAQTADMGGQEAPEVGAEDDAVATDGEGQDDWDAYSEYQTGDKDTYDLTGENDYEKVVKVYKLLNDTDQVVVKKTDDKIQLKDGAAGTEYVIDLGGDDEDASAAAVEGEEGVEPEAQINENFDDIAGFNDEEDDFGDEEESIEDRIDRLQAELDSLKAKPMAANNVYENKKSRKPMKESKEVLFEVDLGYTDNYQDKDPIAGLSNDEPSKSGKSWHKGVPTGTKKPWAGETKSKGEPFKTTQKVEGSVNENDMPDEEPVAEATNVGGAVQQRTTPKSHIPQNRAEYGPKTKRHVTTAAKYDEVVAENKALKKQVKELTEAIAAFRTNLAEAYVTNANLGKITKLFVENTTSQSEKIEIVNRFANEAKTVKQSNALYESIRKELGKTQKTINMNESMTKANDGKVINENKVYKSDDLLKTIDFMNRVLNC